MSHFVLTSGGTGGHVFPAQSLAEELKVRNHTVTIFTDPRGKIFQGITECLILPVSHAKGKLGLIKLLFGIALGFILAFGALVRKRPKALVGFGGYPTIPAVLAAWVLRVPIVVHEQNAVLGRANRLAARFAKVIATSFPKVRYLNRESVLTGNPVRPSIVAVRDRAYVGSQESINLVVIGGSQGAKIFSKIIPQALHLLPEHIQRKINLHQQCRPELVEETLRAYLGGNVKVTVGPFFANVDELLAASTLAISRSGASTVAELTVVGRPAILVPFAHAMDNHQFDNAQALAQVGAVIIPESELTADVLAAVLRELLENTENLSLVASNIKKLGHPDAAQRLADCVERV